MRPFIRIKKIKGKEYLYEISPFLDPVTGKWKQKTRYLGKNVNGAPVKKERRIKTGQVYDLGQFIPLYWAIHEYKLSEILLTCISPDEVALLILVAINRLVLPCAPRHLRAWVAGTYLPKLIPGASTITGSLINLFQTLSNHHIINLFSRMFSLINEVSDRQIIMSERITNYSFYDRERGSGYLFKDLLEGDMAIRVFFDPDNRILTGCEISGIDQNFIEDYLQIISLGRAPGSILLPNWDYFSPVLLQNLVTAGFPFIIKPECSYKPVSDEILKWDEKAIPVMTRNYHGEGFFVKDISVRIGDTPVNGYVMHSPKKEQAIRYAFEKNLQNIRDIILKGENDPDMIEDLIIEIAGCESVFFTYNKEKHTIERNHDIVNREIRRLSRICVLYQGEYTFEECFNLTDKRWKIDHDIFLLYREFINDLSGYQIERIKTGILFICFFAVLLKDLVTIRLEQAIFENIPSFDKLMTELIPIHVIKSYQPVVVPAKLSRRQKTILSYFGGIPSL